MALRENAILAERLKSGRLATVASPSSARAAAGRCTASAGHRGTLVSYRLPLKTAEPCAA